jgi:hypothetical protein
MQQFSVFDADDDVWFFFHFVYFVCLSIVPTVAPQSMQTSLPFRSIGVPNLHTGQSGRSA